MLVQFEILILTPLGAVVGGQGICYTRLLLLAVKAQHGLELSTLPENVSGHYIQYIHRYRNIIINIITAASFITNVDIHKGNANLVELNKTREQRIRRLENQQ